MRAYIIAVFTLAAVASAALSVAIGAELHCDRLAAPLDLPLSCFSIGGTLAADVRRRGAGDELTRVSRAVAGRIWQRGGTAMYLGYRYDSLELDEFVVANLDLHRFDFHLAHTREWGGGTLWLSGGALIATSSNRVDELAFGSDDLGLDLAAAWQPPESPWRLGVLRNRRLGSTRIYPLLAYTRAMSPTASLQIGFPDTALTMRRHGWQLGASFGPVGDTWFVLDDSRRQRFETDIERWEIALTAALPGRHACRRWQARIGLAVARRIRFTDLTGRRIDTALDAAPFASIAYGCAFTPPE